MKHLGMMVGVALLAGCANNGVDQPQTATPATPTVAETPTVPSVPAAVAKAKEVMIFEVVKDDKIHVFSTVAAMQAFQGGQAQPVELNNPSLTPGGKTVVIEAADAAQAEAMLAAYMKLHPTK